MESGSWLAPAPPLTQTVCAAAVRCPTPALSAKPAASLCQGQSSVLPSNEGSLLNLFFVCVWEDLLPITVVTKN